MKYIYRSFAVAAIGILGALVMGSCQSDDNNDLFDKDPVLRMDEARNKLHTALQNSENGWIVDFFPDGGNFLGEYTVWMDFKNDKLVDMKSDLYREPDSLKAAENEYNFVLLKTVALNFPTYGKIHQFTRMDEQSNRTDIEFVITSVDFDGDTIDFEGQITKQKIQFRKATLEDKNFVFTSKWNLIDRFESITRVRLREGQNSNFKNFNFEFLPDRRIATVLNDDRTESITDTGYVAFGAKSDGKTVELRPAVEFSDGSVVTEVVWDGSFFIGTSGDNLIIFQ